MVYEDILVNFFRSTKSKTLRIHLQVAYTM